LTFTAFVNLWNILVFFILKSFYSFH
jgi:hypothetical protein